jgi:hypothetical protein
MFLTAAQMGGFIVLGLWLCAMLAIVLLAIWLLKWVVWHVRDIPNAPTTQQSPVHTTPYQTNGYQSQQQYYQSKEN